MNRLYLIVLLVLAGLMPVMAQTKGKSRAEMRREVREFKLKFLAQEMELKEEQQKKFFELYNQMDDEKVSLFKETRALEKKLQDGNATDAEYESVSKAITEAKEKDAEIDRRYDEKFSTFLSPKQIFKMKAAEDKFRNKMHEMRHKHKGDRKKLGTEVKTQKNEHQKVRTERK